MMYHACASWKGGVVDVWGNLVGGRDGVALVCSMMVEYAYVFLTSLGGLPLLFCLSTCSTWVGLFVLYL